MTDAVNIHASCIVIGTRGVLIQGESGSGKTSLALHLVWMAERDGFARLLGDDRVLLSAHHGRLLAQPATAIEGLVEVWGHGIARGPSVSQAIIDCLVRLTPHAALDRMPEARTESLLGVPLPIIEVPAREIAVAARLVLTALAAPS